MEYLHNEAADSLSVLILVKTKLETLIEHRLAIQRSELTVLENKEKPEKRKDAVSKTMVLLKCC